MAKVHIILLSNVSMITNLNKISYLFITKQFSKAPCKEKSLFKITMNRLLIPSMQEKLGHLGDLLVRAVIVTALIDQPARNPS